MMLPDPSGSGNVPNDTLPFVPHIFVTWHNPLADPVPISQPETTPQSTTTQPVIAETWQTKLMGFLSNPLYFFGSLAAVALIVVFMRRL